MSKVPTINRASVSTTAREASTTERHEKLVVSQAIANRQAHAHAKSEQKTHDAAITAHLGKQAIAATLVVGAEPEEAIAAGHATCATFKEGGATPLRD